MTLLTDYVASLELDDPMPMLSQALGGLVLAQAGDSEPGPSNKDEAFVAAGSTISFVGKINPQSRSDVLNSTTFAQLVANKKVGDREKKPVAWYREYRDVLENIGWVIQSSGFVKFDARAATFEVDKVVLDILEAVIGGNKLKVVKATLDALKTLSDKDDKRFVIFDRSSQSQQAANFQIGLATETDGAVALTLGSFYFKAQKSTTRFLFSKFSSSSTDFYQNAQTITLNPEIYGEVRAEVRTRLGQNAVNFISRLPNVG